MAVRGLRAHRGGHLRIGKRRDEVRLRVHHAFVVFGRALRARHRGVRPLLRPSHGTAPARGACAHLAAPSAVHGGVVSVLQRGPRPDHGYQRGLPRSAAGGVRTHPLYAGGARTLSESHHSLPSGRGRGALPAVQPGRQLGCRRGRAVRAGLVGGAGRGARVRQASFGRAGCRHRGWYADSGGFRAVPGLRASVGAGAERGGGASGGLGHHRVSRPVLHLPGVLPAEPGAR